MNMLQRLVGPLQALVEFHREDRGRDKCINADRFPGVGRGYSPAKLSLNGVFRPTRQGHRENLEAETSAQDGDAS